MTDRTGRVAELVAPTTFALRERRFPAPAAGRVMVDVQHVGVCATELHDWLTGPPAGRPPLWLGHEPVGVVCEVGDGVDTVTVGQLVTGRITSAFADYVYADPDDLVVVPDGVDPAIAIGEPLGCVVAGYHRAQPPVGSRTAVVGLGFMGLVMLQLLTLGPAASVLGIDPRTDARAAARQLGATHQLDPEEAVPHAGSIDLVVEASGTQPGLDLATTLAADHGTLSILGYHQAPSRRVDMQVWNWKSLTVINAHVRDPHDLASATGAAVRLLATGRLRVDGMFTHRYPLDQINEAYRAVLEKPHGFTKAVVTL